MKWMMGALGGGNQGAAQPNPLIATSGKWLATVIALFSTIFWTPDWWMFAESWIVDAIYARYSGMSAKTVYWALKIVAYPLTFFGTRMLLGLVFVSLVLGVTLKLFGGRR